MMRKPRLLPLAPSIARVRCSATRLLPTRVHAAIRSPRQSRSSRDCSSAPTMRPSSHPSARSALPLRCTASRASRDSSTLSMISTRRARILERPMESIRFLSRSRRGWDRSATSSRRRHGRSGPPCAARSSRSRRHPVVGLDDRHRTARSRSRFCRPRASRSRSAARERPSQGQRRALAGRHRCAWHLRRRDSHARARGGSRGGRHCTCASTRGRAAVAHSGRCAGGGIIERNARARDHWREGRGTASAATQLRSRDSTIDRAVLGCVSTSLRAARGRDVRSHGNSGCRRSSLRDHDRRRPISPRVRHAAAGRRCCWTRISACSRWRG